MTPSHAPTPAPAPTRDGSTLLRKAFKANAAFSALSAVVLFAGDGFVAALLGAYDALGAIHFVGWNLVAFAGVVFWLSRSDAIVPGAAVAVIAADVLWVLGSWIAIGVGATSGQGTWAVAIVADLVLILAVVQAVGLQRLRRSLAAA